MDARRLPTPSAVSGARAGNIPFFGKGEQVAYSQTLRFGFDLYKGNPAYRPRDWFFRAVPVVNFNYVATRENNVVDVDVRRGQTRFDTHFSVDDLFVEKRLMRLSPYYDFASLRAGVQGFNADFRGFLFVDNEPGIRLFGNDKANRYQFNLAFFPMLEKDTNSGLNRLFRTRRQTVALLNLYRQDFLRNGFDSAFTIAHNRDRPAIVYDDNGFLVRPTPIGFVVPVQGIPRPQSLRVWYLGWAGNGHIDRWNISHAIYWATGKDDFNPIAGKRIDVNAFLVAAEVSYDRDWRRYRASFVFASGDGDPTDDDGRGFDTIVDIPTSSADRSVSGLAKGCAWRARVSVWFTPSVSCPTCAAASCKGMPTSSTQGCCSSTWAWTLTTRPAPAFSSTPTTTASIASSRWSWCSFKRPSATTSVTRSTSVSAIALN